MNETPITPDFEELSEAELSEKIEALHSSSRSFESPPKSTKKKKGGITFGEVLPAKSAHMNKFRRARDGYKVTA